MPSLIALGSVNGKAYFFNREVSGCISKDYSLFAPSWMQGTLSCLSHEILMCFLALQWKCRGSSKSSTLNVSHLHTSLHLFSRSLSKLPFKCSYYSMVLALSAPDREILAFSVYHHTLSQSGSLSHKTIFLIYPRKKVWFLVFMFFFFSMSK